MNKELLIAKILMIVPVILGIGWGANFGGVFGLLAGGIIGGAAGALAIHIYHEALAAYEKLQERSKE